MVPLYFIQLVNQAFPESFITLWVKNESRHPNSQDQRLSKLMRIKKIKRSLIVMRTRKPAQENLETLIPVINLKTMIKI